MGAALESSMATLGGKDHQKALVAVKARGTEHGKVIILRGPEYVTPIDIADKVGMGGGHSLTCGVKDGSNGNNIAAFGERFNYGYGDGAASALIGSGGSFTGQFGYGNTNGRGGDLGNGSGGVP